MERTVKTKVLSVFGTRPEIVKLVPVLRALARRSDIFRSMTAVTGQHRELCLPFLDGFGVQPDHNLSIMEEDQTPDTVVRNILDRLPAILEETTPDLVLVQGDTSSAFAAALAAFHQKIPVGHVEAGLRTGNKYSPFPEEINRHLIGVLGDLHFAPTPRARACLISEGVAEDRIFVTGNTVIDTLLATVKRDYEFDESELREVDFRNKRVICVTTHRRENFGGPLANIVQALRTIAATHEDVEIVIPVHFNPNVRGQIFETLTGVERVRLIEPLSYQPFVQLLARCHLVLTDSGGVQEEAPSLGKPVLVLRDTTERPEGIEAGTARLAGIEADEIVSRVRELLDDRAVYESMARKKNPYGDGKAGERIVEILASRFPAG